MLQHTIIDCLYHQAMINPQKTAFTFLTDGESEGASLSFAGLHLRAQAIAATLQLQVAVGDRALILLPQSLAYIESFLGCQYAGVIAIPVYPARRNNSFDRLKGIFENTSPSAIFCTKSGRDHVYALLGSENLKNIRWIFVEDIGDHESAGWVPPPIAGETTSYLQFTSGSTGRPKGVVISHDNLLENLRCLDLDIVHTEKDSIVTWLPFFHDLGLIYGVLQPIYSGISCYFMTPVAFLQKPSRWLQSISKFRATCTAAPTFAFALCCEKIRDDQCVGLDLSCLKMAMIGAEVVRRSVIETFSEQFSRYNFKAVAFCPAYGQAECTLKVTMVAAGEKVPYLSLDKGSLEKNLVRNADGNASYSTVLVGCGQASHTEVIIADPTAKRECEPGVVGEVWVKGKTVANGYWNLETDNTFNAYLLNGDGPYVRTGDLGFLNGNNLFISGRLKDVIIINGRNHHPDDIEASVSNCHPWLKPDACIAFSTDVNDAEELIVIHELDKKFWHAATFDNVFLQMRSVISLRHELQVHAIFLLKPGTLPKTSSGKKARTESRKRYKENTLSVVHAHVSGQKWEVVPEAITEVGGDSYSLTADDRWPTTGQEIQSHGLRQWLAQWLSQKYNVEDLDTDQSVSYYGLSSLHAVELAQHLSQWLRVDVEPMIFWNYPQINDLIKELCDRTNRIRRKHVPS